MAPVAQVQTNSRSPATSSSRNEADGGRSSLVQKYLNDCRSFYSCIYCRTHLANHDELVSRSFQGNRSRAYLFNSVVNISSGPAVQRELNTGSHAVADIFCNNCGTTIGWKYEKAYVETQKYKEGKYIIELAHVVRENRHLEFDKRNVLLATSQQRRPSQPSATLAPLDAIGNSLDGAHYKSGSVSPPSYNGQWSSPASSSNDEEVLLGVYDEEEEEDEELMLPFYDDPCADRSSYPGFTASRLQQNRVRRSLYLDSTPYDWKYSASATASDSTASSSPKSPCLTDADRLGSMSGVNPADCGRKVARPNGSCDDMVSGQHFSDFPSPSSSSASGEPDEANKNHGNNDRNHWINDTRGGAQADLHSSREVESETQFKFEADPVPVTVHGTTSSSSSSRCQNGIIANEKRANCDQNNEPNPMDGSGPDTRVVSCQLADGGGVGVRAINKDCEIPILRASSTSTNSISLDDEEFYDCCTEHDVSNSTLNPSK